MRIQGTLVAITHTELYAVNYENQVLSAYSIATGTKRTISTSTSHAAVDPAHRDVILSRIVDGNHLIEYPPGNIIDQKPMDRGDPFQWMAISPNSKFLAFGAPHKVNQDYTVVVMNLATKERVTVAEGWTQLGPIAWAPSSDSVWVGGIRRGEDPALHAFDLQGRHSYLMRLNHFGAPQDVRPDGLMLLRETINSPRIGGVWPGQTAKGNLAWRENTTAWGITADGKTAILVDNDRKDPDNDVIYRRSTAGTDPPVKLGHGRYPSLSSDGTRIVAIRNLPGGERRLVVIPIDGSPEFDITAPGISVPRREVESR
jgi:hypothetical protein